MSRWMRHPVVFGDWTELVAEPHRVRDRQDYRAVEQEFEDALQRAIAAGAQPPLDFVGAGMTGIVFRAGGQAFKVARGSAATFLQEEAEWLRDAARVPGVREHVVRFTRYDATHGVLVREHVPQREDYRRNESKLFDLHQRIGKLMRTVGWGAPEFKPDSYVYAPHRGPVLVDASMPHRFGRRAIEYVVDVLRGRRPLPKRSYQSEKDAWKDLAFDVRREATDKLVPVATANALIRRIALKAPGAAEWLVS